MTSVWLLLCLDNSPSLQAVLQSVQYDLIDAIVQPKKESTEEHSTGRAVCFHICWTLP